MSPPLQWRWLSRKLLETLHNESLAIHGGAPGLRDEGLLESALARAQQLAHYGKPDLAQLAASYGYCLAKNHAFVDGSKRTAFLSIGLFLRLNGYKLTATQVEATITILALAAGELTENELAAWIRAKSVKLTG